MGQNQDKKDELKEKFEEEEEEKIAKGRAMSASAGSSSEPDSWYNKLHDEDDEIYGTTKRALLEKFGNSVINEFKSSQETLLAPDAETFLRTVVKRGVNEIINKGDHNNEQKIAEAKRNLIRFLNFAVDEALRNRRNILNKSIIQASSTKYCPVYPFDEFF